VSANNQAGDATCSLDYSTGIMATLEEVEDNEANGIQCYANAAGTATISQHISCHGEEQRGPQKLSHLTPPLLSPADD